MLYYFYYEDPANKGKKSVGVSCIKADIEADRRKLKEIGYTVSRILHVARSRTFSVY